MIIHNRVYDLRPLLGNHPGGDEILTSKAYTSVAKVNELVHCYSIAVMDPPSAPASRLALIAPKSLKSLSTQKKHVFLGMVWQNASRAKWMV